jgi:hypothetical protein
MESSAQYWRPIWATLERYWKPICQELEGARPMSETLHLAQAQGLAERVLGVGKRAKDMARVSRSKEDRSKVTTGGRPWKTDDRQRTTDD